MHELERLIELARKRLQSDIVIEHTTRGWNVRKTGPFDEDATDVTFNDAVARLREWAGEPELEPEPMTVAELMALRDRASKQLGHGVTVSFNSHGASILTGGFCSMEQCTLEQVVAKLREWATPKLPEFATLENVPVAWVQSFLTNETTYLPHDVKNCVVEACKATMVKLQNVQHT